MWTWKKYLGSFPKPGRLGFQNHKAPTHSSNSYRLEMVFKEGKEEAEREKEEERKEGGREEGCQVGRQKEKKAK